LSINSSQLTFGSSTITALYGGDGSFNTATGSVTVSVTSAGRPPSITGVSNGASFRQAYSPGMLLSVFGTQLSTSTAGASTLPLPNQLGGVSATISGVNAPLYYASPTQLNIQIPYEVPANTTGVLVITTGGQTATYSFQISAAAPGIFADQSGALVPTKTAARGQTVTLYFTGGGAVSPAVATGAAPSSGTALANLPKPAQSVSVTVGGAQATVQFIGITSGLVGVTQVNYQVPAGAPLGVQPVVVQVGNISSPPASLTVTAP
jgi:adhesin/invasin